MKRLDKYSIIASIFVVCGIIGFIYEEFFYKLDLGYFVKRGVTFGPWIPIYAFGGVFIYFLCRKLNNNSLKIFLLSFIITGLLEFTTGLILDKGFGIRLWNYNEEILNFGNIMGYVCLRSVLLFAFSGIFLVKMLVPLLEKIKQKNNSFFTILFSALFLVVLIDSLIGLFRLF